MKMSLFVELPTREGEPPEIGKQPPQLQQHVKPVYSIGRPIFNKVKINLSNGNLKSHDFTGKLDLDIVSDRLKNGYKCENVN